MPNEPREIELKLTVAPADFAVLQTHPSFQELLGQPIKVEMLKAVYFDTKDFVLRDHSVTLRVRREDDQFVQTIKSAVAESASLLERHEWKQTIPSARPDLEAAATTPPGAVFSREVCAALRPAFETKIERTLYRLAEGTKGIDIAWDQGEIVAGNRSTPVHEIELELKYGERAALFDLAQAIMAAVPAELAFASKAERGYQLIEGKIGRVVATDETSLPGTATTGLGFQAIARDCLHHLVANVPGMRARDPEALHQMRIALRRLRTAISLFSDVVADRQVSAIKTELKWLSNAMSPARDLDALLGEVMKPLRKQHPGHRGLASLHRSFNRRRLEEYRHAAEAVQSARFRMLLLNTLAWVEVGEWVTSTDEMAHQRRDLPLETFAAEQLGHRRKKIRKRGREMEKLDPVRRHKLRIQVKKTRYATEFFATLFQEKKSARRGTKLLGALKRLQTSLGGLNDVTTRKALCAEMLLKPGRSSEGAAGRDRAFAAGLVTGDQEARSAELLADAKKAHGQVEDIKPFWK
jgi:inorganic triphosphatase YgiF